jgi:uncharacterized protein
MKQSIYALAAFIVLIASSCAYNSKFLSPRKYDAGTRTITVEKTKTDSVVAVYSGGNYQPAFLKNGQTPVEADYTIESVLFKSSNGNQLNGWMLKPKGNAVTHTLLHLHGNSGSILSQHVPMKSLLKKGFQVFVFDYSGYGFSEGNATRANLLTDGVAAVDYVKTRDDVKNTKLVIYGQSYGGHLAACVAAKRESAVDALVIEGAFSNHKDIAANGAKKFVAFMSRIFVKEIYSGTRAIQKFHKPVLIIHSSEDKVIPFAMGQKLYGKANSPRQFFEIKGAHLAGAALYTNEIAEKIKAMAGN